MPSETTSNDAAEAFWAAKGGASGSELSCRVRTVRRTISKIPCVPAYWNDTLWIHEEQLSFLVRLLALSSSEALPVQSPSALHASRSPFVHYVLSLNNRQQLLAQLANWPSTDTQLKP